MGPLRHYRLGYPNQEVESAFNETLLGACCRRRPWRRSCACRSTMPRTRWTGLRCALTSSRSLPASPPTGTAPIPTPSGCWVWSSAEPHAVWWGGMFSPVPGSAPL